MPSKISNSPRLFVVVGLLLFALGALLPLIAPVQPTLWIALRWLGIGSLFVAGLQIRSLTFWIFWSMFLGLEIGLDQPSFAAHLRFLSDIFLRLIKVIVAPLILGTLVTGIASHSDLKKVGRIGLKSIVYFELVTTVALVIGIAAINISKAGVGLALPAASNAPVVQPETPHWDEFLVHIFPENIVRSIGENQILQVAVFAVLFGIALTRVPERTAPAGSRLRRIAHPNDVQVH